MSEARVKRAIATFALERLEEAERKAAALDKLERNWDYAKSAFGVDHRKGWLLEAVEAIKEPS